MSGIRFTACQFICALPYSLAQKDLLIQTTFGLKQKITLTTEWLTKKLQLLQRYGSCVPNSACCMPEVLTTTHGIKFS